MERKLNARWIGWIAIFGYMAAALLVSLQ